MISLESFFKRHALREGFAFAIQPLERVRRWTDREAEVVAASFLTEAERVEFPESAVRKRRDEWLGGRLAAKEAFARSGHTDWDSGGAGAVSVLARPNRAPYIHGCPGANVSISHSHEFAVAVVAPFRIGVDIEKIEARPASLAEHFCSPAERRKLKDGCRSMEEADVLMTLLWSRKEAVAKFLEMGGALPFSTLDTLGDVVRVEGRGTAGVRLISGQADGYCISVAL